MTLTDAITAIEQECQNPNAGLPFEVFKLVSKLTPMINVDLLIKDASGKTLLTWREDHLCKAGWHIPGGIIRFMENIETRIHKVAIAELGADVSFEKAPLVVTEFIIPKQAYRNHFISLLYKCELTSNLPATLQCQDMEHPLNGQYAWFDAVPEKLLEVHGKYKNYI